MKKRNEILDKVKKLLGVSTANATEGEAISAALLAQKMIVKYDIQDHELMTEITDESIEEVRVFVKNGKKWKYQLAAIIARNFRCKVYYTGGRRITFVGHETDANVAKQLFYYLFDIGNKNGNRIVYESRKSGRNTRGVFNDFALGYLDGIRAKLEKQSHALAIIVPQDVKDYYEEMTEGWDEKNTSLNHGGSSKAYDEGVYTGTWAMNGRHIEDNSSNDTELIQLL